MVIDAKDFEYACMNAVGDDNGGCRNNELARTRNAP